nr:uncharacterized protein LOC109427320 [Aedes albopictus]XP_029721357.1 uncharacterized protein LOC109427320 [Aedes albopictus]
MSNATQNRKPQHEVTQLSAGFRCAICQSLFAKQYSLKHHELKTHGIVRQEDWKPAPATMAVPPSVTTVVIPAIETQAMEVAKARGEIPFAVLHMMNEIPLIVRVVEQGPFSLLKAAEYCDFRESQRGGPGLEEAHSVSIAVVATVYQKIDKQGRPFYEITGPMSCYQTGNIPQLEEYNGIMQESLESSNIHKTLTQLNATEISCTTAGAKRKSCGLPVIRPHEVNGPLPSTTGTNKIKRKIAPKPANAAVPVPIKRATLKQPRAIAVAHNPAEVTIHHNTPPRLSYHQPLIKERSFQDIVTGSLLSPERPPNRPTMRHVETVEVISIDQEDPFRDINVMDLIGTGNEMLSADMEVDIEGPDDGIYIPVL